VNALHRKLFRDLRFSMPQVLSITSVLAGGIASLVSLQGTMLGLREAWSLLYDRTNFADAEVRVERAPEALLSTLSHAPGVRTAEARIVLPITLPVPNDPLPPFGVLVSLADTMPNAHNRVIVLQGRRPERSGEVLLLASFAKRYGLRPGDSRDFIAKGTRHVVRITGIATSAEFVVAAAATNGLGGDQDRFAVMWMRKVELAPIAGLNGAFNSALFMLDATAPWAAVRASIDRIVEPYGGLGAFDRAHQPSDEILVGEFDQLSGLATVLPMIFLAVAAFLVNVVVSRLITLQRPQIATLAAVGYRRGTIAAHYLQFVSVIAVLGTVVGVILGALLGRGLVGIYADYFNLPKVAFQVGGQVVLTAFAASIAACCLGVLSSLRAILRLAPADAMRPPAPTRYRRLLVDRVPMLRRLSPTARMVAREIERNPSRAILSIVGLASAVGILIAGRFNNDAIPELLDLQFNVASREDASVGFLHAVEPSALASIAAMPGVLRVEGIRALAVRIRHRGVVRDVPIVAYDADARLRRLVDINARPQPMPADGLLLSRVLAKVLDVTPGDSLTVELREGRRPTRVLAVAGIVDDMVGSQAYADPARLAAWLGEGRVYSGAVMQIDPTQLPALRRRLAEMGTVTGFTTRAAVVRRFRDMMARTTGTMTLIETIFAAIIAAGLVYNSARVALSTRGRDLASLRVLGFTRGETSAMLLGEQAFFVVMAIVPGLVIGRWFVRLLMATIHEERIRIPPIVSLRTDAFAIAVLLCTAAATGFLIYRRMMNMDLVAVLKTRE
jgi:putative ABC transport system permease protein